MKFTKAITLALVAVIAAAVLPSMAGAHSAVRSIVPNKAVETPPGSGSYVLEPAPENTQYVVSNHNYNLVLRETNGVTDNGILAFALLPGAWRNQASITANKQNWFDEGATGAQPHATCSGSPQLGLSQVLAWQGADPFYAYIPFQKTSVGLEDDPAAWIQVVKGATGFDLATLPDDPAAAAVAAAAACSDIGGTYVPADTVTATGEAFAAGNITEATAALDEEIAELGDQVSSLTVERDAAQADLAQAQAEKAAAESAAQAADQRADRAEAQVASLLNRPLSVALASRNQSPKSIGVLVAGKLSKRATVQVTISAKDAKRLKTGRTLAKGSQSTGRQGSSLFGFNVAGKLRKLKGKVKITVTATLDGSKKSATGSVSR